jgi:trans-aconitate methyltransferase
VLDKNLFLSDIALPPKAKILDIGTSSGIWAIEVANEYPDATVVGIDISPQQLPNRPIPPNCSFVVSTSIFSLGSAEFSSMILKKDFHFPTVHSISCI